MDLKITTNNQPRSILYWCDLSEKERAWFDYYKDETSQEFARFFRYKGEVYDLNEFSVVEDQFPGWSAYQSDSFFSGIVIRFTEDYEEVVVGRYCC